MPFSEIPIYSDAYTAAHLRVRMPYCFVDKKYPGVPRIYLQEVEAGKPFFIRQTEVLPVAVMHGRLPILGYRIGGRLGYVTDMLTMPDASYEQLQGLDVLVMNACGRNRIQRTKAYRRRWQLRSVLVQKKLISST